MIGDCLKERSWRAERGKVCFYGRRVREKGLPTTTTEVEIHIASTWLSSRSSNVDLGSVNSLFENGPESFCET